jgi:hypothetical protein
VETSVERALDITRPFPDNSNLAGDIGRTAEAVLDQHYVFASWPIQELWDPGLVSRFAAGTDGLVAADYAPSVALSVTRPVSSNPLSVIVPTAVRVTAGRTLTRRADAVSGSHEVSVDASFAAPNVFGRLGTRPVFGFYDTDEILTNVAAGFDITPAGASRVEIDVEQQTQLLWLGGRSLEIVTSVAGGRETTADSAEADLQTRSVWTYAWSRGAPLLAGIERLAGPDGQTPMLDHSEALTVESRWVGTRSQHLTVTHTSVLRLDERGSISVHGGLGIGVVARDSPVVETGIRLGLEGSLRF